MDFYQYYTVLQVSKGKETRMIIKTLQNKIYELYENGEEVEWEDITEEMKKRRMKLFPVRMNDFYFMSVYSRYMDIHKFQRFHSICMNLSVL
jgi:hypothetical protein